MDKELRLWRAYGAVTTLLMLALVASGFQQKPEKTRFGEIDVERINIVEKDGKLRMVISNQARFPDPVMHGQSFPRSGSRAPGMLFYNDDGDENGGLIFNSSLRDGKHYAGAAFLFDQYQQDQTIGLMYEEGGGKRVAALRVWDRPDTPLWKLMETWQAVQRMPDAEKKAAIEKMRQRGELGAGRVFVGKDPDRDARVVLSDSQGRARLALVVTAAGQARLDFLDENGKVTRRYPDQKP